MGLLSTLVKVAAVGAVAKYAADKVSDRKDEKCSSKKQQACDCYNPMRKTEEERKNG